MFVILGIVLVAVILSVIFLRKDIASGIERVKISQSTVLQNRVAETTPFVEDCVKSVAEDGVLKIMARGGYNEPKKAVQYDYYTIPVYFDKGKESVQTIAGIEKELALYVQNNVPVCANVGTLGFPVKSLSKPAADVSIGSKAVSVAVDWQLQVGGEQESATIRDFSADVKAGLTSPYEYAIELYNKQKAIKVLSLIDLARLAKQKDFILHFDMQDDAMVYLLTFNRTLINKQPLVYTFAIRQEPPKKGGSGSLLAGASPAPSDAPA